MRDHGAELTDRPHALERGEPLARGLFLAGEKLLFAKRLRERGRAVFDEPLETVFVGDEEKNEQKGEDGVAPVALPESGERGVVQNGPTAEVKFLIEVRNATKVARRHPFVAVGVSALEKDREKVPGEFVRGPRKDPRRDVGVEVGRARTGERAVGRKTHHAQQSGFD